MCDSVCERARARNTKRKREIEGEEGREGGGERETDSLYWREPPKKLVRNEPTGVPRS